MGQPAEESFCKQRSTNYCHFIDIPTKGEPQKCYGSKAFVSKNGQAMTTDLFYVVSDSGFDVQIG